MKLKFKNQEELIGILKSILGFIVIYFASAIVVEIPIILILHLNGIDLFSGEMPDTLLTQSLPLYGFIGFIIGAIIYVKYIEKRPLKTMGFTNKKFIIKYLKGFGIGILIITFVLLISLTTGVLTYQGFNNDIKYMTVIVFFIGFLIQGMGEEVLSRGYLFTSLTRKTTLFWAVLISSLVFTYPHLSSLLASEIQFTIIGFTNTMLFSVLVTLFMIKKRSIWGVAAIHSAWNFILGVFCGISVSGKESSTSIINFNVTSSNSLMTGGSYGLEAGIITTIILIISIAILGITMRRVNIK